MDKQAVKRMQSALVAMGYDVGPRRGNRMAAPDGIAGKYTEQSLARFYSDRSIDRVVDAPLDWTRGGGFFRDRPSPLRVPGFKSIDRTIPITQIVLHESVTWTAADAVSVLERRGLGVNYVADVDAAIIQHLSDYVYAYNAGSPYNARSISIEIANRYYGQNAKADQETISGIWVDVARNKDTGIVGNPDKLYIVPPMDQLEAVHELVVEILGRYPLIPQDASRRFPSGGKVFYWGRWAAGSSAGVVAHHRWAHADALFPEHYLNCRFLGLSPCSAYNATLESASSGKRRTALPRS